MLESNVNKLGSGQVGEQALLVSRPQLHQLLCLCLPGPPRTTAGLTGQLRRPKRAFGRCPLPSSGTLWQIGSSQGWRGGFGSLQWGILGAEVHHCSMAGGQGKNPPR